MSEIKRIPFTCTYDCGSRCELVACVRDGHVIRIDTPAKRSDTVTSPRLIPCARGRAYRRTLNSPRRLLKPLRRVGSRGSGMFEEVSWDKALDEVAEWMEKTKNRYGSEAIFHAAGAGSIFGRGLNGGLASTRLFSYWSPVTETIGGMSTDCSEKASEWMFGKQIPGSDRATLLDSRLIIMWSINPAENIMGPNTAYFIAEARDNGARVVLVDPRYTDSGILADQWIPIKPGTDAALVAAMAYVMESEELLDEEFMEKHTGGYSPYKRYILGEDDGKPKTPVWAEKITGVQKGTIFQLARNYAQIKPAALLAGWGYQRSLYGEQSARALMTLACMSGNVGVRGGGLAGAGTRDNIVPIDELPKGPHSPARYLSSAVWASDILEKDLKPPIKMAYIVASNIINRSPDTSKNILALKQLDFIVVQDQFFTPTARYADVVLPICTDMERTDLVTSWGHDSHLFLSRGAIGQTGESRTDYWVFAGLAERLGLHDAYTQGRDEEEWLSHLLGSSELDADSLKQNGVIRMDSEPRVALSDFRADPRLNPLSTASGLIEISCSEAEKYGLPLVPSYVDIGAQASEKYPLQLVTPHSKLRANSCLDSNPWLRRLEPHKLWINSEDAEARRFKNGDLVKVTSKAGTIIIPAMVTERIMPGVVCVYQGTWHQPNKNGEDEGRCANVLTSHITSPTGGFATHSDWVEARSTNS